MGGDFRDLAGIPTKGTRIPQYTTLIRDLVFGKFGEIPEDSEADRDLVEDADSSKGHATAAHRVCIFWGTKFFGCYNSSYLPQHATNFVPQKVELR